MIDKNVLAKLLHNARYVGSLGRPNGDETEIEKIHRELIQSLFQDEVFKELENCGFDNDEMAELLNKLMDNERKIGIYEKQEKIKNELEKILKEKFTN